MDLKYLTKLVLVEVVNLIYEAKYNKTSSLKTIIEFPQQARLCMAAVREYSYTFLLHAPKSPRSKLHGF